MGCWGLMVAGSGCRRPAEEIAAAGRVAGMRRIDLAAAVARSHHSLGVGADRARNLRAAAGHIAGCTAVALRTAGQVGPHILAVAEGMESEIVDGDSLVIGNRLGCTVPEERSHCHKAAGRTGCKDQTLLRFGVSR